MRAWRRLLPDGMGTPRRHARRFLPELIYGANDGVVTTLAVISSVTGAQLAPTVILILGFASLLADGVSMAVSDVLAERSRPNAQDRPSLRGASKGGLATFLGFLVAGFMPLSAYLVPGIGGWRFTVACVLAGLTLFVVGASRSAVTDRGWLRAGAEMLILGAAAGVIAYAVGALGAALTGGAG